VEAVWRTNNGHHSARHDFTVDIKDADHPITRGLKSFPMQRDELYANLRWQPEGTYRVLATAYDDHSLYNGRARQPTPGAGIHQSILWTTEYGKGRVFTTALGHDADNVRQSGFAVTFARGAEWAATGTSAAVFRGPPFGFDQVFAFHPVQHGVKHALGPFDLSAGQFPHVLNEFIADTELFHGFPRFANSILPLRILNAFGACVGQAVSR
jgi:hypothetical protein